MAKGLSKNLSTKVLSARVTPDVYAAWQSLAKSRDLSVSECLRDAVVMVDKKAIMKAEDGILVPDDFKSALGAIAGGSLVGIVLYKGIRVTLESNSSDLDETDIEGISILLALSGAILIGSGLYKALK